MRKKTHNNQPVGSPCLPGVGDLLLVRVAVSNFCEEKGSFGALQIGNIAGHVSHPPCAVLIYGINGISSKHTSSVKPEKGFMTC